MSLHLAAPVVAAGGSASTVPKTPHQPAPPVLQNEAEIVALLLDFVALPTPWLIDSFQSWYAKTFRRRTTFWLMHLVSARVAYTGMPLARPFMPKSVPVTSSSGCTAW